MKKPLTILLSILLIGLNLQMQAQTKNDFLPPQNFAMGYDFILQHPYNGYCVGGHYPGIPYCFNFYWHPPENDAKVVGYNLYYYNTHDPDETKIVFDDAEIIVQSPLAFKFIQLAGDYEGFFWVTAIYEGPDGESSPSNLQSKFYTYDFMALNDDGIPIYYNFCEEEEMSVVVTHKYSKEEIEFCIECDSYSGNIIIPETVIADNQQYNIVAIGENAFSQCSNLTNVSLPNSIIDIADYAFNDCFNLNNINLPNSVVSIGSYAFNRCLAFSEIIIPNSVIEIGNSAFVACVNAVNIKIGENVTTIGSGAFSVCSGIENIFIPEKVIEIGAGAFNTCNNLSQFFVSELNEHYSTIDGVLFSKDKTLLHTYPNAKSSVYSIPEGVSVIGLASFRQCKNLIEINIPTSVTIIEATAFYLTKLSSVTIPETVTKIERLAFGACYELKKVIIPNVNIIFSDDVFWRCEALEEIFNMSANPQTINRDFFLGVDYNLCKLFVPFGSYNAYREHNVWGKFSNIIETDFDSIEEIKKENISVFSINNGISINSNEIVHVELYSIVGQKIYQSTFTGSKEIPLER